MPLVGALLLLLAAPWQAARAEPHLLAWGDSLTAGGDWLGQLDDLGYAWTFEDHGSNGEASWHAADGVEILANDKRRFRNWLESEYLPGPDDVFVFLWGTNDVRVNDWAEQGEPAGRRNHEKTRLALEQIVDDALATGAPVAVGIPPPFLSTPQSPHTTAQVAIFNANVAGRLTEIVQTIVDERAEAGQRIALFDVYGNWLALPGWPSSSYYEESNGNADGIHPGAVASPSGHSGRYHVAEVIPPAVLAAVAVPEPPPVYTGAASLWALGVAMLFASFQSLVRRPARS